MTLAQKIARSVKLAKPTDYSMPAEWEKHDATWLAWPHARFHSYWGCRLQPIEETFTNIISGLEGEVVNLLVVDDKMEKDVRKKLSRARVSDEHVIFYHIPTEDVWTRDYGPIFIKHKHNGTVAITEWIFNGWGKFPDLVHDSAVPARIAQATKTPAYHGGLVLEGGSIEVNGAGTLLTTAQCLLNRNRNPYHSGQQIEETLRDYLGAQKIIWLLSGLCGDDTDGHIDNVARFVREDIIAVPMTLDKRDGNYKILEQNRQLLATQKTQSGKIVQLIDLPTPGYVRADGQRKAASYANFYIANEAVLVPTFGHKNDSVAVGILSDFFGPARKIVPINCLALVASGGTIHCVTQQQPAGTIYEVAGWT